MEKYLPRIADALLAKKLKSKGAVLLEGAKWCGKTTTAARQAGSVLYMQDPDRVRQNLEMAELNPSRLLQGQTPRMIDEWQIAENLWDAVRFEVDKRDAFGQFILTGSAVPPDLTKIRHTGTGRFARVKMRPMSLFESGDSDGTVSLTDLFRGETEFAGESKANIDQIAFLICRGGWPRAVGQEREVALSQAADYYDAVVASDISRADQIERDEERTKRLMRSYSRAIGSQAKIPTIIEDMKANDVDSLSAMTVNSYINALKKIFVIEDSPAWNPNLRSKSAIRTSDTRYFTDSSIAAASLGVGPEDLINDLNTMGLFFENLCVRDLRVYAEALDGMIYHYRDKSGLECDAVLHRRNGTYGLIEIKLGGARLIEEGAAVLKRLEENIDTERMKKPSFKMVLTGVEGYAYCRPDGVLVVPVTCLKP